MIDEKRIEELRDLHKYDTVVSELLDSYEAALRVVRASLAVEDQLGVHPAEFHDPQHPEHSYTKRTPEMDVENERVVEFIKALAPFRPEDGGDASMGSRQPEHRDAREAARRGGGSMRHELKVLPGFFKALWCGDKTFEIRKNDRHFEERDEVVLQEWESADNYTGREINGFITYLTDWNQVPGYVVFSFRESGRREE